MCRDSIPSRIYEIVLAERGVIPRRLSLRRLADLITESHRGRRAREILSRLPVFLANFSKARDTRLTFGQHARTQFEEAAFERVKILQWLSIHPHSLSLSLLLVILGIGFHPIAQTDGESGDSRTMRVRSESVILDDYSHDYGNSTGTIIEINRARKSNIRLASEDAALTNLLPVRRILLETRLWTFDVSNPRLANLPVR